MNARRGNRLFSHGAGGRPLRRPSPGSGGARGVPARVLQAYNDKMRADVQAVTGPVYRNVEYVGPAIDTDGKARGRFMGLAARDLVWLDFAAGAASSPRITATFSRPEFENIEKFLDKHKETFDVDDDFADFHKSGHAVVFAEDQLSFFDSQGQEALRLDYKKKEVVIAPGWQLRVGGETEADSTVIRNMVVSTPGTLQGLGGVSAVPGLPTPGVLVVQNIVAAGAVSCESLTAATSVRAGAVGLESHGHPPDAPGAGVG